MRLEIISISNKPTKWEEETLKFYLKQISPIINITFVNIKPAPSKNLSIKEIQTYEEKNILKRIKPNSLIVSFDIEGKQLDSLQFASFTKRLLSSTKNCYLIIGGSNGLSKTLLEKSDHIISFSALTFPHKLFKILLIEQIYRSITILQNKSYHK